MSTTKYQSVASFSSVCFRNFLMAVRIAISVLLLLVLGHDAQAFVCPRYIYTFGDSLADPGNAQAENPLFYALTPYPYGESYRFPDRPCERTRFSDGRLIVDYTAQAFGFPFLEPYSRRFADSAYSHGVNFAYSGGTAKIRAPSVADILLGDVDVSTALHFIPEIGGNDFTYAFTAGLSPAAAKLQLSDKVMDAIKQSLEKLHDGGAKSFYIFNQRPAGCTPYYLTLFSGKSPKDEFGCLSAYNDVFQNLNVKLKAAVDHYRQIWPDTVILLFDWYAASIEVLQNQAKYGINANGLCACCGGGGPYNFNLLVPCGPKGAACPDPEHTLYWDEVHYTEAFYRVIATFALTGQFVDGPPMGVNLKATCNLDFTLFAQTIPNPPTACLDHQQDPR